MHDDFTGPPVRWFVGGLPEIASLSIHKAYEMWAQDYAEDGVFKVFWGGKPHVVVASSELTNKMLTCTSDKFCPLVAGSRQDQEFIDNHMLVLSGEAWKERRIPFNQFLFNTEKLRAYFPTMLEIVKKHVDTLGKHCGSKESFDIWRSFQSLTLDIILTVSSGLEVNSLQNLAKGSCEDKPTQDNSLGEILVRAMRDDIESFDVDTGMKLLYLFPDLRWFAELVNRFVQSEKGKKGLQARAVMTDAFGRLVDGICCLEGDQNVNGDEKIDQESFIAAVSTYGKDKPRMWAIVQTYMFNIAGFETTANALGYTCHLLASNPDKQRRVLEEIEAFGREREPSFEDLEKLPYLQACFAESLRLLPPAPFTLRRAPQDIMFGKYKVPEGTWMHNMSWITHQSPEYWTDPSTFSPERFLSLDSGNLMFSQKQEAYFPFGGGGRKCPGYKFAQQEAILMLLSLLQRYRIDLPQNGDNDLKLHVDVTLSPRGSGVQVLLEEW